jgi:effector-binding domain-containing protein
MSVRIHAIAKEIKKTSKELLEILAERGYELKSASSTIDNITAESLIEEFKSDAHDLVVLKILFQKLLVRRNQLPNIRQIPSLPRFLS